MTPNGKYCATSETNISTGGGFVPKAEFLQVCPGSARRYGRATERKAYTRLRYVLVIGLPSSSNAPKSYSKAANEGVGNLCGPDDLNESLPFPILSGRQLSNTGMECETNAHTSRAALPSHSIASSVIGPSEAPEIRSFHIPSS